MMVFPKFHTTPFNTDQEREAASRLPPAERQAMVKNVLFPYDQFLAVSKQIEKFHRPVEGGDADTGWLGGLIGEYRSGKTFILQNFARQYPPVITENGFQQEVIYLQARVDWDTLELGRQIYLATGIPTLPRLTTSTLNTKAARRVIDCGVKLIIVDDAHCLLGTPGRRRTVFISLIKYLLDQVNACNILLVGPSVVERSMETDLQMLGRGGFPRFRTQGFDSERHGRTQFRIFLHGVDQRLPFRSLSDLSAKRYISDLYEVSDGSIGMVMNIVIKAAYEAINDDTACIMREHLEHAAKERLPTGKTYKPFGQGVPG
ncbi:TniB family NTP-binding protein [Neorhizobium galegae]|uniref:TniB family NTP-binding protein n=1 Tax=Neorhizobium galegae TaxID=399 RepID=UPI00126A87FD|nr:TniB family NTP-binding protein [Neorhizobium galegae]KAA9387730.1 AAA family ATPase [Neorhizobium galegae]MCM2501961.1 TniB family NTP-binding protein [Neorhizobium galegae]MCQ1772916.1 TniB family NTP-binding protein [Neorhizobium galegae]MCQ1799420.1 TniB family NTP-binding protein [Neorhizobium galegae]